MASTVKAELLDKLWQRMSERGDFPMLSQALRTTVSAMSDDDLDFTALVQVVLSDFGLTQKVLRLANSAMYMAFGGNITTVTRALMVLGMDAVGHLVVGLKLVDHFHASVPRRIDAKLELNRTLLSGAVARQITEHTDLRSAEEAVVCTLMRQIGKLLVAFYLESEWDQLRRKAAAENISDSSACSELLGVSFEEIGIEAADRWRLPETIRAGMRASDPQAPDQTVPRHVAWLQAVTNYSTEVADALTAQNMAGENRESLLVDIANRYSGALNTDAETLAAMSIALANEESGEGVMREIVELRANADAIARAGVSAEARIGAGLDDLRALPSKNALGPVLALASEAVLAGLGFSRTVVFVRQANDEFHARLGLGPNVERMLPTLQFAAAFQPDVFHLAISNPVGIFIENAHDPRIEARLPRWFKQAFGDAKAFVLLPVKANDSTVALVYGDWTLSPQVRKITPPEMSALNELTRELSRFFSSADWKEVELL
ncbi:putative signal transduction protein [Caballeronia arationis]|jgi:HD-like signal output (HDOD) protein|uniref:HD-like signal output (HDOD) domain, no enzymatic activity n=1 Tax=Caballeronia arationis TaxID=1777142 RepID=A0A7Z7N4J1_9BURK|nr:HDOD domain-containing protein [Caballeronia arationis]SAK74022.1 putative signal transduction protein [Caballeronia arationis]SOE81177.1 HD-like signal output (HDOD) domain, no enzymatic activity [Caballeronia arationis]